MASGVCFRYIMAAAMAAWCRVSQIMSGAAVANSIMAGCVTQDTGAGDLAGKTGKAGQAVHIISHHFSVANMRGWFLQSGSASLMLRYVFHHRSETELYAC